MEQKEEIAEQLAALPPRLQSRAARLFAHATGASLPAPTDEAVFEFDLLRVDDDALRAACVQLFSAAQLAALGLAARRDARPPMDAAALRRLAAALAAVPFLALPAVLAALPRAGLESARDDDALTVDLRALDDDARWRLHDALPPGRLATAPVDVGNNLDDQIPLVVTLTLHRTHATSCRAP